MTNYTIDGSVYTYPFHNTQPDIKEIDVYSRDVLDLYSLLFQKQDRYVKQIGCKHYFLFRNDIKLVMEFIEQFVLKNRTVPSSDDSKGDDQKIIDSRIRDIFNVLIRIITRKKHVESSSMDQYGENETTEQMRLDSWFDIEDVTFLPGKEPLLPDDILVKITDQSQRENIKKNLAIIAALNKYVYKNNITHNIIMSKNITEKTI